MSLNTMPRTIIDRRHDPNNTAAAAIAAIAAAYRDHYPLPRPLDLQERSQIVRNTERLSIYDIDTTLDHSDQRMVLKGKQYIELAILACEAFLAASKRLGAPRALRRFVRHTELPELKGLTKSARRRLVKAMMMNTGWVDSLLELVATLKPLKGHV